MTYGDQLRRCAADAFARLRDAERSVAETREALRSGAVTHERLHLALLAEQAAGLVAAEALLRVGDHDRVLAVLGAAQSGRAVEVR